VRKNQTVRVNVMAKTPVHTSEAKSVGPGVLNTLPGPDYTATTTYSNGEVRMGIGNTPAEAQSKSQNPATSHYQGTVNKP